MSEALPRAELITCSFSGDLDVCRLLCRSIDRYVAPEIVHRLYVPSRDLPLFADLATPQRQIATQESLLPRWFVRAPMPGPRWRARLGLPRRNVYLTPFSAPVRGWIAQQMMKIAAALRSTSEIVVHIDSDNAFVRPFRAERLIRGDFVRLYAGPVAKREATHEPWYEAARALLDLPAGDYYRADYIDQLVVWRRSLVEAMVKRIEEVSGRSWQATLARTPHFAEYILYGVFAERAGRPEAAHLFVEPRSLCHSRWEERIGDASEEMAFIEALRPEHVACLVQSTIPMSLDQRQRIYARLAERAALQDAT